MGKWTNNKKFEQIIIINCCKNCNNLQLITLKFNGIEAIEVTVKLKISAVTTYKRDKLQQHVANYVNNMANNRQPFQSKTLPLIL